ncbi:hypothetical protein PROFUN_13984 [Planoprotostelium fungivorum]|uniref:Uncharacterized protein n=1 Tax=Planoprotostelium fungivorum TaxID=1890364 RepID=A0A2P6N2M0_9EUKA|nr:hypothetical protein PROFUN_13984 [Planoprotostelium fungivorum]
MIYRSLRVTITALIVETTHTEPTVSVRGLSLAFNCSSTQRTQEDQIDNQPTGFERCIPGTETKGRDGSENGRIGVGGCGTQLVVVLCLCRFFAVIRSERSLSFLVEAWIGPLSTKQLLRPLECSSGLSFFRRHQLRVVAVLSGAFAVETIFFLWSSFRWPTSGCLWWTLCFWDLFVRGADPLSCADNGDTSLSLSGITRDGHVAPE